MTRREIEELLFNALTDGFNRSVNALEEAGAIDMTETRRDYCGVGSGYYDLVTRQMEITVAQFAAAIEQAARRHVADDGQSDP